MSLENQNWTGKSQGISILKTAEHPAIAKKPGLNALFLRSYLWADFHLLKIFSILFAIINCVRAVLFNLFCVFLKIWLSLSF